jgi:hypothetical protein
VASELIAVAKPTGRRTVTAGADERLEEEEEEEEVTTKSLALRSVIDLRCRVCEVVLVRLVRYSVSSWARLPARRAIVASIP